MDLTRREMPGMGMGLMDLDLSVGVLVLCVMLSAVLFGFLTVQVRIWATTWLFLGDLGVRQPASKRYLRGTT